MNMWIIEETSFGRDLATHASSLASLECVFYPNQRQCVQENTLLVAVSGFSQIYYRQLGVACTAGQGLLIRGGPELLTNSGCCSPSTS